MATTPVNITQLQIELTNYPERDFVDYLLQGFTWGFDTKIDLDSITMSKECKNLQSAVHYAPDVDMLIHREVTQGYLCGPFKSPPFKQYRVSPIGVVLGKYSLKKRLIVDLSAPHKEGVHPSINSLIDKDDCSLSYVQIDDAIKQILKCGKGAQMCKTDISDAFKIIPIKAAQYHLFCIKWRGAYYFYNRLCFGCRSSPYIFDSFSKTLCWIATNNYNISFILHLLDDFLTIDGANVHADVTKQNLLKMFANLNVPLAQHKTLGPDTTMEYLGITLDSVAMQARLPHLKVIRISELLGTFLGRKTCTKRELLQLLGHLNFASRVILPGRSFVSHLLALAHSVKELHHHIHLSVSCREDIHMWQLFLQQWNGVSMFHDLTVTPAYDLELYTDASSTVGFGGYFQGHWFSDTWPSDIPCPTDKDISMAFRELYPIVVAALLWGHLWQTKRILFHCDNLATVQIIHKGRSKVQDIMPLMRQLTWQSVQHNFCVYAKHLPGTKNTIADALSRLQMQRFRELAPYADRSPHKCPTLQEVLWTPHLPSLNC
jgi:hypothetical protein